MMYNVGCRMYGQAVGSRQRQERSWRHGSDALGSTECLVCGIGRYAASNGTTECTICPTGKYNPLDNTNAVNNLVQQPPPSLIGLNRRKQPEF